MPKALIKLVMSLALAVGLSLGVASTPALATTHTHAVARTAERAPSPCASQQARVATAKHNMSRASRSLKRLQHNHHVKHRAAKIRAAKRHVHKAKRNLGHARHARNVCTANHQPTTPPAPVTSDSPIQALCDAGVPQEICDQLAGLIPGGTGTTGLPISDLCTQVPGAQQLCDALGGGIPDVTSLQSVLTGLLDSLGLGDLVDTVGLGDLTDILGNLGDLGGLGGLSGLA